MRKSTKILSVGAAITTIISAVIGVFYSNGGIKRDVVNIYGQKITLYGDGIYANNTLLKVGATKGTDIIMILISIFLLAMIFVFKDKKYAKFLQVGLLVCMLYATACLIMGVSFNRIYPLYLLQFSFCLFSFIISLTDLLKNDCYKEQVYKRKLKGTAVFLIIGGCSVLIWLTFIIPAIITGTPSNFIEIYTSEPTFAIDLGVILPTCIYCGIAMLKQKEIGYKLAPVLLTLITGVGGCVISQTAVQIYLGIELNLGQIIGMVMSFVILGAVAILLNIKLLKYAK